VIVLVRHGQSTANARGQIIGRGDAELTELGRDQARALAPSLVGAERVLTSPLARAVETARLALPGLRAELDESFVEQDYGALEGVGLAEAAPALAAARANHDERLGGGESLADVDRRVHARLAALGADELAGDARRHLVVVSHVSPIKSAVAWAVGAPGPSVWRLRLSNATLTVIEVSNGRPMLWAYNSAAMPTPANQR
jgi:broad specificity phosphatase PhoE